MVGRLAKRAYFGNKNLFDLATGKTLKPRWIWFGVTDLCNSHCTHCNIWQKKATKKELTLEEIEWIFKDPLLSDVEAIINSGGEAILRPDIVEIIKLEHKYFPQADLDLSTNAILADRAIEVVEAILGEGIKIHVGVSLDGLGEKHDQIRGTPGNFAKVERLLKRLVELRREHADKLSVVIGFTLSSLTVEEWEKVKQYADKLDIEFSMQWYNQSSFYDNNGKQEAPNRQAIIAAVEKQPKTIVFKKWRELLDGKPINFQCFAAQTFFVLRPDGEISPCLSYWDLSLGNAKEKSLTEIWQSEAAVAARTTVAKCQGCLNSWGVEWSISSSFYPRLWFYIKNPKAVVSRLKRKD